MEKACRRHQLGGEATLESSVTRLRQELEGLDQRIARLRMLGDESRVGVLPICRHDEQPGSQAPSGLKADISLLATE